MTNPSQLIPVHSGSELRRRQGIFDWMRIITPRPLATYIPSNYRSFGTWCRVLMWIPSLSLLIAPATGFGRSCNHWRLWPLSQKHDFYYDWLSSSTSPKHGWKVCINNCVSRI